MLFSTVALELSFFDSSAQAHRSVLAGADLRIEPGEHALVLGSTGTGKTALLKALAGLLRPHRGQVQWDGLDVAVLSAHLRQRLQARLGFIFQTDALFDALTVEQNVRLPLDRRRVPKAAAAARVDEVLAQVGLLEARQALPEQLSGGMRKRTGIARAIAAQPEVLFADDPLAGLDAETARTIAALLTEVTQDRTLVVAACDPLPELWLPRWIVLSRGRVTHDGPPDHEKLTATGLDDGASLGAPA